MAEPPRPIVAVHPPAAALAHRRLFAALEDACCVRLVPGDGAGVGPVRAEIRLGSEAAPRAPRHPRLMFADAGASRIASVHLERCQSLDPLLRGIELDGQQIAGGPALDADDEVLATTEAGPVWTRERGAAVHRVQAELPLLDDDEVLRATLGTDRPQRMLATLALVEFLRGIADDPWPRAPLRATFVFDDPNLRLARYGHIDYRVLWDEAARHGYHVGMAMVPLDAGRPGAEAVDVFRHHREQLSLAIHGNDHVAEELLRSRDRDDARALAAQALRRVARFEQRTGLSVGRVMVPPHGMCSPEIVSALGALGFDGLCSLHPTPWTERAAVERPLAGWTPATFVDSCAVIPRVPLQVTSAELALRAYLGQPLVLYGHHNDVADGYELLTDAAARVNRLGPVEWLSLSRLVRSNYQLRLVNGTAHIRPWGTRLDVALPSGTHQVVVELPPHADAERFGIDAIALGEPFGTRCGVGEPASAGARTRLALRMLPAQTLDPAAVPAPVPHPRAWARRRAAEFRDQLAPAARRASRIVARP